MIFKLFSSLWLQVIMLWKRLLNNKDAFVLTQKTVRKVRVDEPRYIYQQRFNHFEIKPGQVVVDIGSGHDPFPQATILCDRFLMETEHRHSPIVRDGRPLIVADVEALPFKNKSIDFILCSHVLEHVNDPLLASSELQRVANAGYIETPNYMKDVLFSWAYGMHRWHTVVINKELHFFEYTQRQSKGIQSSIWREIILGKNYHPLQEVFYDNQDLFNTMFQWMDSFDCIVHRLDDSIHEL